VAIVTAAPAAQPSDRWAEALARRAAERLQALQREAEQLTSQERTLLGELRAFEIQRQLKTEEVRQADEETAVVQKELDQATKRIDALERQRHAARPDLQSRIVEMYKLGRARYLRLLLSTSDVRRIGEASRTIAAMAELDRDRTASYQRTLDALNSTRATLEAREQRLIALRAHAVAAQAAAGIAVRGRNELIRDIDSRRDLNAQLLGELQAAQQKLQLTLRSLPAPPGGDAAAPLPALPLKVFRGDLDWPVRGAVRRPFIEGSFGRMSSNGIEIAAMEGAPVVAVHDGVVAFADSFTGLGNLVILDHGGGAYSLYGNLLEVDVRKGLRIQHGQQLGTVGVPVAGAAGVYFELRVDGQPVDPLQWLRKRPS
jgi:septal ring factor EnvC (AmiA/AmiB activator)